MSGMIDRGADGDNQFIAAQGRNRVNAYSSSGEDAADSKVVGTSARPIAPGSVGNRLTLPGGSQGGGDSPSSLDRPYHGDWKGRLENRTEDTADAAQLARAQAEEKKLLNSRADQYSNHGNVGWSGNYPIDWPVER